MPTIHHASADDTLLSGRCISPTLLHAFSELDLKVTDRSHFKWRQKLTLRTFPRRQPIIFSFPSKKKSSATGSSKIPPAVGTSKSPPQPLRSICEPIDYFEDDEKIENREDASFPYPTPPASESGDIEVPPREEPQHKASYDLPFPLEPVSLASASPVKHADGPRTPRRTWNNASFRTPTGSLSPDRFVTNHSPSQDPSRVFRLSKHPQELAAAERELRHDSASSDPFGPLQIPRTRDERPNRSDDREQVANRSPSRPTATTDVADLSLNPFGDPNRQIDAGAIWNVGGSAQAAQQALVRGISDGRGGLISSGSNARMYTSLFLDDLSTDIDVETMEKRLAAALDINRTGRVFDVPQHFEGKRSVTTGSVGLRRKHIYVNPRTAWRDGAWVREDSPSLLDAPNLRDDFYCTALAYCYTTRTLAVGLANRVYLWSEDSGVRSSADDTGNSTSIHITALSFSSTEGGKSILAIGRNDGQVSLWSPHDSEKVTFSSQQESAISCVAFKPVTTRKPSERSGGMVPTEELLVGDEAGNVYYYSVEWMTPQQVKTFGWVGSMKLIAMISVHSQQICGLAWSPKGDSFATGANDNACCLFEIKDIFSQPIPLRDHDAISQRPLQTLVDGIGPSSFVTRTHPGPRITATSRVRSYTAEPSPVPPPVSAPIFQRSRVTPGQYGSLLVGKDRQKHKWMHGAAIKAIAFCPWQRGLIATGGGSNDRAIHFYHTYSGATLATINVHAQVTSLIWSTTRREIAATLGYAQPDHPYRIVVFSWPACRQVVAIPWGNDMRALLAIPYPGGPGEARSLRTTLGGTWYSRTAEEGCIVIACSDESVRFHEVWSGTSKSMGERAGLLGGSSILEGLEAIEGNSTETIR